MPYMTFKIYINDTKLILVFNLFYANGAMLTYKSIKSKDLYKVVTPNELQV